MRKQFYLSTLFVGLLALNSCKKDKFEFHFDDVLNNPYTTGIIKLQYQVTTTINGQPTLTDTTVSFTAIGDNPADNYKFGYSQPSDSFVQLIRLNPTNFVNSAIIYFNETNLNSLTFPYKFKFGVRQYAHLHYTIGYKPFYDPNGNLIHGTNTYAASTMSNDFELTVLSRVNNRLQGTFSGRVKNQDGLEIDIKKGLFDIQIVEK